MFLEEIKGIFKDFCFKINVPSPKISEGLIPREAIRPCFNPYFAIIIQIVRIPLIKDLNFFGKYLFFLIIALRTAVFSSFSVFLSTFYSKYSNKSLLTISDAFKFFNLSATSTLMVNNLLVFMYI